MKRMYDEKEIEELIEEYAPGFDPSTIEEGTIAEVLGLDSLGALVKNTLNGKYVRIINAPSSDTLSESEFEGFKEGIFIKGEYEGLKNPIVGPASLLYDNAYHGTMIGPTISANAATILAYTINKTTRNVTTKTVCTFSNDGAVVFDASTKGIRIFPAALSLRDQQGTGHALPPIPWPLPNYDASLVFNSSNVFEWREIVNNIAPEFSDANTYAIDDLVMHEGTLYKCTTAITTAGAWSSSDWTRTYISEVI